MTSSTQIPVSEADRILNDVAKAAGVHPARLRGESPHEQRCSIDVNCRIGVCSLNDCLYPHCVRKTSAYSSGWLFLVGVVIIGCAIAQSVWG